MAFGLFGTRTFTDGWRRPAGLALACELSANTLNNVILGAGVDLLSFLGPVGVPEAVKKEKMLKYPSLGLAVGFCPERKVVTEYRFAWQDSQTEKFSPYPGGVLYYGMPVVEPTSLKKERLLRSIGNPFWAYRDATVETMFYSAEMWEWQFDLTLDGALLRLRVSNTPLMADPAQQKRYGMKRPWPPDTIL